MSKILERIRSSYIKHKEERMSLNEYLELIKTDKSAYANPAERMLKAIGEPTLVDTQKDPKLGRIFANKTIKVYDTFKDFYGMETAIESIVSYFQHSAQGLEEQKQILYLLGPVGGGKSSLAEKLKRLMEQEPIYVLAVHGEKITVEGKVVEQPPVISPVFESPLGLFKKSDSDELKVPERYFHERLSPWALKRLKEFDYDLSKFLVVKIYPSEAFQRGIAKTEPGDENNQDISTLVGKVDIKKLTKFSQHDPDAYSYSGGLNISNQGLLEFVEMFKAPIKVLHPLLTATQEGNYNGTEPIGSIPFEGVVLAHSNEAEWQEFRNDKNNEAFIDRINIIKVPYTLRVSEERKVYEKLINNSALKTAPCAPYTLDALAQLTVMSRLKEPKNTEMYSKMQLYDGENIKDQDPKAKSFEDYKNEAGIDEGMAGISTRFAYKTLSKVFNYDATEIAANPIHLFNVVSNKIKAEQLPKEIEDRYISYLNKIKDKYKEWLEKEIRTAYIESYDEFGQNRFDHYITLADVWLQEQDYRDPDTGELLDFRKIDEELRRFESAANINNSKDFRQEVTSFVYRIKAQKGHNVNWKSYKKLADVIEKQMFTDMEQLLPIISFGKKENSKEEEDHSKFVERMMQKGYTKKQVRIICDWFRNTWKSE